MANEAATWELRLTEANDLYERGLLEEAFARYAEVLAENPSVVAALSRQGAIRAQQGRLDEAEQHLQTALAIESTYAPALSNVGNVHFSRGNYEQAMTFYEQAIAQDPQTGRYHENLAAAYRKLGRMSESVKALKQARKVERTTLRESNKREYERAKRRMGCGGTALLLVLLVLGCTLVYLP